MNSGYLFCQLLALFADRGLGAVLYFELLSLRFVERKFPGLQFWFRDFQAIGVTDSKSDLARQ